MPAFDPISFAERCYDLTGDPRSWLARVAAAANPALDHGFGTVGAVYRIHDRGVETAFVGSAECAYDAERYVRIMADATPEDFVWTMLALGQGLVSASEITPPELSPDSFYASLPIQHSFADHVTLSGQLTGAEVATLGAHSAAPITVSKREKRLWRRLGWHFGAAWRLRQANRDAEAVIDPSGQVVHAEADAKPEDAREALRQAVIRMERARTRRERANRESIALWPGLIEGRWSLVDRFESDGRRYVIAHANPPDLPDPRGLTVRERDCAMLAAHGHGNASIAYGLGLTESTVSSHVSRAMRKLGLKRRTQLFDLMVATAKAQLLGEGTLAAGRSPEPCRLHSLTKAENEVAALAAAGETDAQIAERRGTSSRTAANQLRSVYRKLGVHSRTGLARALVTDVDYAD